LAASLHAENVRGLTYNGQAWDHDVMTHTDLPPFELPKDTSLAGLLGMIICWWWDDADMRDAAAEGVYLIPKLLAGETELFTADDWWIFEDAIGTYLGSNHERSELMDVYEIAKLGHEGRLPPGMTKRFVEDDDENEPEQVELIDDEASENATP
jgi:hypothetical protein